MRNSERRTGIEISVTAPSKERLAAIVAGGIFAQKYVWRARIILLTAQGMGTYAIMGTSGKSKSCSWHWQECAMAKEANIAASAIVQFWDDHCLRPHRRCSFKPSNDKTFVEWHNDFVSLHFSKSAHAIVLSVDKKNQIQELDLTQPGRPMKRRRGAIKLHDHTRNGTTTLFAALNIIYGSVIGPNIQRHRHQELVRFLNGIGPGPHAQAA